MKHRQSVRAIMVALLGVMTVPVATQRLLQGQIVRSEGEYAIYHSQDMTKDNVQAEDIRESVKAYQTTVRAKNRAYVRAVERCRDRLRTGEDIVCPDINDPDSFGFEDPGLTAVQTSVPVKQAVRSAAPAATVSVDRELTTAERELLRTNTRARYCSSALGAYLYSLCISIVGDKLQEAPVGITNDNVKLHSEHAVPPTSLKLRLQMLDEAISGSKGRRSGVAVPMRFQGGLNR
ncbi:hypothetical protein COU76_00410 [Candidatus Peregrinibacteria bacterium CG10_big_fil_rev_8_21_14_0_10_49_10]|nr:MAG: hypothetical protein COU76_00410 [Candidatus Peregrinibacteria bacterium CG10_big_fil_rev_8_21_14_0_10_49_10]